MPLFSKSKIPRRSSDEDQHKLLGNEESQDAEAASEEWYQKRNVLKVIMSHVAMLILYTTLFTLAWTRAEKKLHAQHTAESYSPGSHALQWRKQYVNSTVYEKSPYSGNPSPEVDAAWKELMYGFTLRVEKEDLDKIGKSSIPLNDGSGQYIAGLDTTHHLHCLWSIRHALAPHHYPKEVEAMSRSHPDDAYPTHIAHCLEILRMQLMCRGDAALFTYAWDMGKREPLTDFAVEHTCANWDKLKDWTEKHSFDVREDLLTHPVYGK
ncbi:hypothetical protein CC86DRAFT_339785 [Ophiobolus disseminans]|uniref:Tat pathway signal sequence n=1 Tax=Ophiobolus disseminans TaxID=1469910 RepID=A0A6A7AL72_9PLEO|nr:hypothetical protein CC86DRAFT_339785 [Ophiobolus disseminans]